MKKALLLLTVLTTSVFSTPRAIVFDFGGVMTIEADHSSKIFKVAAEFIRKSFGLSEEEFLKINQQRHLALKQGKSDELFWTTHAKEMGIDLPDNWYQSLQAIVKNAAGLDMEMYALVNELKQNIHVGLLTNSDGQFTSVLRDCRVYQPFDPCLISSEIGVRKPDLKAYELLLLKLNLPAGDVIFIDDRPENIEAAKKIGLDGILFESHQQLEQELIQRKIYHPQ